MDGLRGHRHHGCRKTGTDCGLEEGTPVEGYVRHEAIDFGFQHAALLE
jgi:hypothetical protein